ncbi:MAG: carboxy terminal-processing peptidase [Puniceicoccales bacterium]|jgi:carboxyl-terminal processing protease|nr:carboxy terminal-processing peptidase [Puniceicoccales bacterium]
MNYLRASFASGLVVLGLLSMAACDATGSNTAFSKAPDNATLFNGVAVASTATVPTSVDTDNEPTIKKDDAKANYTTTHEMQMETQATAYCLERGHILQKPIRALNTDGIVRTYASNLDSLRLFFLEPEIKAYTERFGPLLDYYFGRGNLSPAFSIYTDFLKHVEKRVAWINTRLEQPFDLNTDETFVADRSKASWPKNKEDADRLWEKRLKLDLILELLGDDKAAAAKSDNTVDPNIPKANDKLPPKEITPERLAEAVKKLQKRYNKIKTYLSFEPYEVEEIYLNTLTTQYDPHTTFFSKQSLEEFDIAMRNSLFGVGALLQDDDGYCTVKDILPGGPIEDSKRIKVGDRIIAIGQGEKGELVDIVGMRLNKVVNQLRGPVGTVVRLRIEPATDRTARYTINLVRSEIKLTTKLAQATVFEVPVGDKLVPIGLIDLPAFYGKGAGDGDAYSTTDNVEELLNKLKKHKIQGLILDLRRNGGGLLDEAVRLTGLFIPTGPVLQARDVMGKIQHLDDTDKRVVWDGPLIVLVTKLSASASEIVAGALQDHHRAIIVGDERTHGKGTVQAIISYDKFDKRLKSAAKMTIQKWYLPSGNSIQVKGIAADIPVSSVYSVLPIGEADLDKPLPWDAIPSILDPKENAEWRSSLKALVTDDLLKVLREDSARRQAEMPEFLSLNRTIAWTKAREKSRAFPLNYEALREERGEDKAFRESIRSTYKELESTNYKSESIKLDAAIEQEKKEKALHAADNKTEKPGDADEIEGDDLDDTWPEFDIQKRESLRIMGDWLARLDGVSKGAPTSEDLEVVAKKQE